MTDPRQILNLYTWEPGVCFQHPAAGETETAVVKELHTRLGPVKSIRACPDCVMDMEAKRRHLAEEAGIPYLPGHAGAPL
ncbi:hypothetical protein OG786_29695 [Streptomyces sp. NBC_00101]|uniref:hypothetical protein n=1 Tax=Streptomyces sp. NBC_00101 TaxID=2975651 RepID=UPI00324737E6